MNYLKAVLVSVLLLQCVAFAQPELDTTFNSTGIQVTDVSAADDVPVKILVQSNNKPIVLSNGGSGIQMVRYNQNGSLDTTFGNAGIAAIDPPGTHVYGDSLLLPDGKIMIVGAQDFNTPGQAIFFARFNINGTLDTGFGTNGVSTVSVASGEVVRGMTRQSTGELVTVGSRSTMSTIRRFLANGSADTSFNATGEFATAGRGYSDIAIETNGNYLVLSQGTDATFVVRYSSSAVLLTNFAPTNNRLEDIFVQDDGKIVVGGSVLARYTQKGSLDSTFGKAGIVSFLLLGSSTDIVGSPQGGVSSSMGLSAPDFGIFKYDANGTLDTSFSEDGRLQVGISSGSTDRSTATAYDWSGRQLVAGTSGGQQAIIRLNASLATVSGRATTADGRSLARAWVTLDDGNGVIRSSMTNTFGFFSIPRVPISHGDYTVSVRTARPLPFTPQTLNVYGNVSDLMLVAD